MLLRLVPRSFGQVMQQANRIYLKMSMVFLQSLHPHLSHDPFPSLRSLSSRVTLFQAPRPTSKQKQRRARCYGWEGSFKYLRYFFPCVSLLALLNLIEELTILVPLKIGFLLIFCANLLLALCVLFFRVAMFLTR